MSKIDENFIMFNKEVFGKNSICVIFGLFRYAEATDRKCAWAYKIFQEWIPFRNNAAKLDATKVSFTRDLIGMDDWERVYALKHFIMEVRKQSGEVYPAETLYEVVICLQMYLNSRGINVKLLDDPDYVEVRNCLDNRMKELSQCW